MSLFGVVFLTLYAIGVLPGVFALPAGFGDVAITQAVGTTRATKADERRDSVKLGVL